MNEPLMERLLNWLCRKLGHRNGEAEIFNTWRGPTGEYWTVCGRCKRIVPANRMPGKFVISARVQSAPFQPKKWTFLRYVYMDIDGTLYTKPDYPPPPLVQANT